MMGPQFILFATTRPDGSFHFPQVLPGSYQIDVFPKADSLDSGVKLGTIIAGNTDLTNLEIPMTIPSFKVSGRATGVAEFKQQENIGKGDKIEAVLVDQSRLQRPRPPAPQPGYQYLPRTPGPSPSSALAADDTFLVSNVLPGDYRLTFSVIRAGSHEFVVLTPSDAPSVTVVDKDIEGLVAPARFR